MRIVSASPVASSLGLLLTLAVLGGIAETRASPETPRGFLRVGVPARSGPHSTLTTLVYWGGFPTKTACYEGLTTFDPKGEVAPALADAWEVSSDGRVYTLHLREGVTFHDGRPLDAAVVRDHLERWRGNPANRWLGSTGRMQSVEVVDPGTVRVTLSSPWPFLEECAAAINPAYIVGRGAYDNEGTFETTVGTGPYRLTAQEPNAWYSYRSHDAWWQGRPGLAGVELVVQEGGYGESETHLDDLRNGRVDLVADGSSPRIPRELLEDLGRDPAWAVRRWPGTATTLLLLNNERDGLREVPVRQRLAAAIDREALVAQGELGYAVPSTTLFLPGRAGWPEGGRVAAPPAPARGDAEGVELSFPLAASSSARVKRNARLVATQLESAGFTVNVELIEDRDELTSRMTAGDWDLAFRDTYGVPYDPWITLQTLFFDRPAGETASSRPPVWRDDLLREALGSAFRSQDPVVRRAAFAAAQQRLDEAMPLVPLFVSDTVAVGRQGIEGLSLGSNPYDLGLGAVRAPAQVAGASGGSTTPPGASPASPVSTATPPGADPRSHEVALPAENGWEAFLVHDNGGVGIWVIDSFQVFPKLGCPEIVGLDDRGRVWVCHSYSGKWTPHSVLEDGSWLGGLGHGDVDPAIDGEEIYTGSENGNLYEIVAWPNGILDSRLIGTIPGRAINQLIAAELDPASPGEELLLFTWPGGLYQARREASIGTWEIESLQDDASRVRQVELLPPYPGRGPELAVVSRDGLLEVLRITPEGPVWETVYQGAMGMGRLSVRTPRDGQPTVVYSTHDDGRILRHQREAADRWTTETIYLGPQGPRGILAGRFDADPEVETVAIFGYSTRVELLSRRGDGAWKAETIFRDIAKGHWLARAEVEGRNGTDEMVCSGYGGRMILLSRPPGYGRRELLTAER